MINAKYQRFESLFGDTFYDIDGRRALCITDRGEHIYYPNAMRLHNEPLTMSLSQAFRYWQRYFPERTIWELPEMLKEALLQLKNHDWVIARWHDGTLYKAKKRA